MKLTNLFPNTLPVLQDSARYHTQTGYAEDILVIIWTCAVVKVSAVKANCEIARFRRTCWLVDPTSTLSLDLEMVLYEPWPNAHTPETTKMNVTGAARRKSGAFDSVQYLNNPTCLKLSREALASRKKERKKNLPVAILNKCIYAWESLLAPWSWCWGTAIFAIRYILR